MTNLMAPSMGAVPDANVTLLYSSEDGETQMLKFLSGTVGIIFLIGLVVVIGLLALIF